MLRKWNKYVMLSLLGSSALTASAFAQTPPAQPAQPPAGQECQTLSQLMTDNPDRLPADWVSQANGAVQAADPANCVTLYQQAQVTLGQNGGATAEEAARIVVTQPDPTVNVQQTPPEVSVSQPQPQVSVSQGQPEITVRQAAPNVRVQMPQPVITIDMPQPEIIVRMPEPDVAVTTPQPQVEVRQAQPQVTVQQGQPQVQVQATPEAGNQQANVQVEQGEAQVTQVPAAGQPQVNVQRQEPVVNYEAAQPNIQVEQAGEPQVQFNQSGEAQVRVEQANGQSAANGQPAAAADTQPQGASGDDANVVAMLRVIRPMEAGQPTPTPLRTLIGQQVVNADETNLGTVEGAVRVGSDEYVVLGTDSPIARDNRAVVLPLQNVSMVNNRLVFRGLTDQELAQLGQYNGSNAQPVGNDEQVQLNTM